MKWYNAHMDKLPRDNQTVLILVNDIYYDAIYSAKNNLFTCTKHENITFRPKFDNFYWTNFNPRENKKLLKPVFFKFYYYHRILKNIPILQNKSMN